MHRYLISLLIVWLSSASLAAGGTTQAAESAKRSPPKPHIALLLPLKSPIFAKAAEMVRSGFMAGAAVQPGKLGVRLYESTGEPADIVAAYQQATQAGAAYVVGPLTRDAVATLATDTEINVPTLALNLPESPAELPALMRFFPLSAEQEARQVARLAYGAEKQRVAIIASDGALSQRIAQAFAEEWKRLGGVSMMLRQAAGLQEELRKTLVAKSPQLLFLAMDGREGRLLRPFLPRDLPTYATSQIHTGGQVQRYHDLAGIRFVDMPWVIEPEGFHVMTYPRPTPSPGNDMERLYAFGIDAWQIILHLQTRPLDRAFKLDGVTGTLEFDPANQQIQRLGMPAQFENGSAQALP